MSDQQPNPQPHSEHGIVEHTTRKRAVSISSCDSDPLAYRHVGGGSSRGGSVSGHSSFFDGSAGYASSSENEYEREGNLATEPCPVAVTNSDLVVGALPGLRHGSLSQGVASTQRGTAKAAKKRVDVDEADMEEFILRKKREAEQANTDNANAAPAASSAQGALAKVPTASISSTPFAVIESVIPRSSTIVAAHTKEGSVVDCGASVCLADGTIVGTITTLLGAVLKCRYAIVGEGGAFAELLLTGKEAEGRYNAAMDEKAKGDANTAAEGSDNEEDVHTSFLAHTPLAIGTALHFDTTNATIIFDPMAVAAAQKEATDASFVDDDELPHNKRPDFSDDEKEREWKRSRKAARQAAGNQVDNDDVMPLGATTATTAAAEPVSDVSSSGSEAEFDDDGQVVSYKPKSHKGAKGRPTPAVGGNMPAARPGGQPLPNYPKGGYNATVPTQAHPQQAAPAPAHSAPTPTITVGGVVVRGRAALAAAAPRAMDTQASGFYAKPSVTSQRPDHTSGIVRPHPAMAANQSDAIGYGSEQQQQRQQQPAANPYPYPDRDVKRYRPEQPAPPSGAPKASVSSYHHGSNQRLPNQPPPPPPTSAPPPPPPPMPQASNQPQASLPSNPPPLFGAFMGGLPPPPMGTSSLGNMGGLDAATVALLMSNPQLLQGLAQQQQQLMLMAQQMMFANTGGAVPSGFPQLPSGMAGLPGALPPSHGAANKDQDAARGANQ